MLQEKSSPGEPKPHWTQTPAGRKKMSKLVRASYKSGTRKARDAARKRVQPRMDQYVLAKRLQRQINNSLRAGRELDDFIITAHLLIKTILEG